jgi:hypothetical protein
MIVGVVPNAPDFAHPADRRRYVPFFRARGIPYETADFAKTYDAVYISIAADLGRWAAYRDARRMHGRTPKVIFDLSDDVLSDNAGRDLIRGAFYALTRRNSRVDLSYKRAVLRMVEHSDVVLCGSDEQKSVLDRLHPHVVVMRDLFGNDLTTRKSSWALRCEGELHVLWEGLSHGNLEIFRMLRQVLDTVTSLRVHAHVVTDPSYCHVSGRLWCEPTWAVLERAFRGSAVRVHHYSWTEQTFSAIAASCDIGVIPVPQNPVMQRKPENKLLLLWQVGLPTIATATPSYTRVMRAIGTDFVAAALSDWGRLIGQLAADEALRAGYMAAASRYLDLQCSAPVILQAWDRLFPLDGETHA